MKNKITSLKILFLFFFNILLSELNAQKTIYKRDFSLKDSIPVEYNAIESEESLQIKSSLKLSNEFNSNSVPNKWNNYRNLSLLEYGTFLGKLPIQFMIGYEKGMIYEQKINQPIFNIKCDFRQYFENIKQNLNLSKSLDNLHFDQTESIFRDELNKKIQSEIGDKLKTSSLDSLNNKMKSMQDFEAKLNNPLELEKIQNQKIMLKEKALGNKLDGINYDSIANNQNQFDSLYTNYNLNLKDSTLSKYRGLYNEILTNKDKALELKNKTEERVKSIQNGFKLSDQLNLSKFKISKLNLGQTSVDHTELVFRGFMINGINIELKAPFYFNAIYSLPFQTNLFSNYTTNSIQNNKISTLGFALGTNSEKNYSVKLGYYQFKETKGDYYLQNKKNTQISNQVLSLNSQLKLSNTIQLKIDIAKSESNKFENQSLFSEKDLSATALKLTSDIELPFTKTKLKIELQNIGLNYYSSANPFVQKGRGGLISLDQKISSKLSLKSKTSYRYGEDSNQMNVNLSTYATIKFKLNRNTSFEWRGNYFQTEMKFQQFESKMKNATLGMTWLQRVKLKSAVHNLQTTIQYGYNEAKSSSEINNTGLQRNILLNSNYNFTFKSISLNANLEENYQIDSARHLISNGVNLGFPISTKTQVNFGGNSRWSSTQSIINAGINFGVSTEIQKINFSANANYNIDKLFNINALMVQVRAIYSIF